MKKVLTILIVLCVAFAISAQAAAENQKVSIRLLSQTSDAIQNTILDDYIKPGLAEKFPNVEIVYEAGGGGATYENLLKTYSASGDLPDVFFNNPTVASSLLAAGAYEELTGSITKDGFINNFANSSALMDGNNKIYTLDPGTDSTHIPVVFYYKNIFKENGYEIPQTFDELLSLCEKMTKDGVTPFSLDGAGHFRTCFVQAVVQAFDPNAILSIVAGKGDFTDPAFLKAYEAIQEMRDNGYFQEGYASATGAMALQSFQAKAAAMYYGYSWNQSGFNADEIGVFAFPTNVGKPGDSQQVWGAKYCGYAVYSGSKNKDVAIQVAEFCTECAARYYNENGTSSNLLTDAKMAEPAPLLAEVNEIRNNAKTLVPTMTLNAFDSYVGSEWTTYNVAFIAGQYTAEELIKKINVIFAENTFFN